MHVGLVSVAVLCAQLCRNFANELMICSVVCTMSHILIRQNSLRIAEAKECVGDAGMAHFLLASLFDERR